VGNPSAADLRSEVARHQLKRYELAARVGMHPTRLAAFLNEKLPLRPAMALRIQEALEAVASERRPGP
jgi:plasmid maintenance system antidote protein VapI